MTQGFVELDNQLLEDMQRLELPQIHNKTLITVHGLVEVLQRLAPKLQYIVIKKLDDSAAEKRLLDLIQSSWDVELIDLG